MTPYTQVAVDRGRTAMERGFLSRPVQLAFDDGLIGSGSSVFDFGCGRGGDIRRLLSLGVEASGWDPIHAPRAPKRKADVVNLGYVINVIEHPHERVETILEAWELAGSALVVAARPHWEARATAGSLHGDGIITSKGTFQKFYDQEELRVLLDTVLQTRSVAAGPGVFYAFKSEEGRQRVLANLSRDRSRSPNRTLAELILEEHRELLEPLLAWVEANGRLPTAVDIETGGRIVAEFRSIRSAFAVVRRATGPSRWDHVDTGSRKASEKRFEENLDTLQPLIDFLSDRGRLPRPGEIDGEHEIASSLGSVRQAYSLIRRVTGEEHWATHKTRARESFTTYVATAALSGRPRFSDLPPDLQADAKDFYGSYSAACEAADRLLFDAGNLASISEACATSPIGKLTSEALYVHVSALGELPPVLRVYEGCARALSGRVNNATILKLHKLKPQVSYLIYPEFDRDAHPVLQASVIVRLASLRVDYRSFVESENPPILHRKELFVGPKYPGFKKFRRLTIGEEKAGLLNDSDIGTLNAWRTRLRSSGLVVKGHRLVREDPV